MVKINEFADTKLGYDIVEDAAIYMRNNPLFYRQHYFPAMTKCQDAHRLGKKVDMANIIKPMIEKGCNAYCKQYKIGRHPEEIFRPEERQSLYDKIYSEEIPRIEAGEY